MAVNALSTEMGGAESAFPKTRWSVISEAGDPASPGRRRSLELLARLYWRPIYAYLRRRWGRSNEEAKDLTQEFFLALAQKEFLGDLGPQNGLFRSYVRAALDNFVRMDHRRRAALKRGGGGPRVPLEIGEGFNPSPAGSPEQVFMKEWAGAVLEAALGELEEEYRAEGKETAFRILFLRDVEAPREIDLTYEGLARRFALKVTDVTHLLYFARRKLRELVLRKVRDTVTSPEEAEAEMLRLFSEPRA